MSKKNDSIMMQFLNQKQKYPKNIGDYSPENDELSCAKNQEQMKEYFEDNPHKGMPYGMPQLNKKEYNLLANWLAKGAQGAQRMQPNYYNHPTILKWELFFNRQNIKTKVTARYLYEHLYLAHIQFDTMPHRFFKIVRSKTPSSKNIELLPTRLVYNKPSQDIFYYRFEEITSTLVHKTHMVYKLNNKKLSRYKDLFIKPKWIEKPYEVSYETKIAANAIKAFEQIPPKSRYTFLLDDIHFFIMNFIRGPVCRGQVALNVINDHFWVVFLDPKYDASINDRFFLHDNLSNLTIPNEEGVNPGLLNTLHMMDYAKDSVSYYNNRNALYKKHYPKGLPLNALWKGNQTQPNDAMLTIYRHFDSASVHKGALGNIPKTLWVIDYALLERIYYSLVAGYDVFGNITQSLLVRKYMDRLRIEGESNFLEFLPPKMRKPLFSSWYKGWLAKELTTYTPSSNLTSIEFPHQKLTPNEYKRTFVKQVLNYTQTPKDGINYVQSPLNLRLPEIYNNKADIQKALKILSVKSNVVNKIVSYGANLAYIKINMPHKSYVYSMVVNRWHNNVALLFNEDNRLDPSKDTVDYIEGFVGSYPNYFFEVNQTQLYDFFHLLQNYEANETNERKLASYGINRAHPAFWEKYDWFQHAFNQQAKETAGLFDLNRYYKKAIH
jgi:hypothetical protein